MTLTESEKKALEQAKKIEARWPKTRWIALALGFGMVSIGIIDIQSAPVPSGVLLGLGVSQWILVLKIWSGRPMLKLLIKFAERNEGNSN